MLLPCNDYCYYYYQVPGDLCGQFWLLHPVRLLRVWISEGLTQAGANKRPARAQQPDAYLEPKWLRCLPLGSKPLASQIPRHPAKGARSNRQGGRSTGRRAPCEGIPPGCRGMSPYRRDIREVCFSSLFALLSFPNLWLLGRPGEMQDIPPPGLGPGSPG